jgi:hypothetical protein
MSKEQTPIEQEMLIHFNGKRGIYLNKAQIREVSEFLNAKVLEALEREFTNIDISMFDEDRSLEGKFYYETEVKPKYE